MKRLFVAIRQGDLCMVQELLQKKPELVNCIAKQPPKKYDGQSPLQVALKSSNFAIAKYLLIQGADINFIETESCNNWKAPVIHDAINAAVMCSRWNVNSDIMGGLELHSTKEAADEAYSLLENLIYLGADVNAVDSYGNSCIWRACLQARQILPSYNHVEHKLSNDRILTDELRTDLVHIFQLLINRGADLKHITSNVNKSVLEFYKNEPVAEFLQA